MPLNNIRQPEIIFIREGLRLRKYGGDYAAFLPAYQDPYIYQNSEGIFDTDKIPDLAYVQRMCGYLDRTGELYLIQAEENGEWRAIGDVTAKPENPPIAIWDAHYRRGGVGTAVMRAVTARLRELGYAQITGSEVFVWNIPSQKLHEKLGFVRVSESEREYRYELELAGAPETNLAELYIAVPEDAAVCARIQTASWKAAFKGIISAAELERAADEERALKMYERVLARGEMHGLILKVGGAPHCIAFWGASRDGDTAGFAELICIHSLPDNWRRGYGTLVMDGVLEAMRAAGYKRAMLWVFEANSRARGFYEKCGWALTGRTREELGANAVQYERVL